MSQLVQDMVQPDPSNRPTIDQVAERFEEIRAHLSWWKLRSRVVKKDEFHLDTVTRVAKHSFATVKYLVLFCSPVPKARK